MSGDIDQGPRVRGRRYLLGLVLVFAIGLTLFAMLPDRLLAAIELAYYRAAATTNAVFLEWATVREVNVNGFEIMCKKIDDPDTAFHPIGSRIAIGSPTSGATYNFDVTSGLIPGQQYCFRLREITSDNTPGEEFDLCGYGLGVTPAPTAINVNVVVSIPLTLTPTIVAVTAVPGLPPAPTLAPTIDPFATVTPIPTIDPFLTLTPIPTIDPFLTLTPVQPVSVLATPTATLVPTVQQFSPDQPPSPLNSSAVITQDASGVAAQLPPLDVPTETPTETPWPTDTPLPTAMATLTATEEVTPAATLTQTFPLSLTASGGAVAPDPANPLPVIPDSSAALAAAATPTPLYVVVTATPTPLPALVVAPTFTPWPTAAPTETFGVSNLLVPNTQNLMVGLLCLIFLSASGLGALGLVTSVLYMRSQSRRERLPGPVYERRRY